MGDPDHRPSFRREIDLARRLLLDDQSRLTRHFKRLVGTNPGRYAPTGTVN